MRISDWSSDVCSSDLEVVADAAGQVPAIVELLCVGGLRKGKAREKGDTQHADLHCRLLVYGYKARNRTGNLTARYGRHRRPPPRTATRASQSYLISVILTIPAAVGGMTKTKPGMSRASGYCLERRTLVLEVPLVAAVGRTAFRIVLTVVLR